MPELDAVPALTELQRAFHKLKSEWQRKPPTPHETLELLAYLEKQSAVFDILGKVYHQDLRPDDLM